MEKHKGMFLELDYGKMNFFPKGMLGAVKTIMVKLRAKLEEL